MKRTGALHSESLFFKARSGRRVGVRAVRTGSVVAGQAAVGRGRGRMRLGRIRMQRRRVVGQAQPGQTVRRTGATAAFEAHAGEDGDGCDHEDAEDLCCDGAARRPELLRGAECLVDAVLGVEGRLSGVGPGLFEDRVDVVLGGLVRDLVGRGQRVTLRDAVAESLGDGLRLFELHGISFMEVE